MTLTEILTFAFVASLLVMSPGPNGLLIAKTVPTSGRAAGFANIAGFVSAFFVQGTLSLLGLALILLQSAVAFAVVKYLGAAYLCWIGLKALIAAWRGDVAQQAVSPAKRRRTLWRAYGEGLLTNLLNPKTAMFYLAAFPQFISASDTGPWAAYHLIAVHSLINGLWFGAMVLLFAQLSKAAQSGAFQRWLKAITGVIFIGFAAKLASMRAAL
ncbi:LysE family translocator [Cognatishimia sp. SS12]|uniref:LysE family translocator n=1 Tax=Cognatishimia sp. SS12 TaxID=2979465 RepID=UPI00232D0E97|nr:LysE family translocator [Cognatishimia sp. SS12]MDC0738561.1 LysE family translocator [Cognatishimia sp. SS12]